MEKMSNILKLLRMSKTLKIPEKVNVLKISKITEVLQIVENNPTNGKPANGKMSKNIKNSAKFVEKYPEKNENFQNMYTKIK